MNTTTSASLEVLGFTADYGIAFRWHLPNGTTTDEITLTEDELGTLAAEYRRDALPMWPVTPCADCGTDAAVEIEGRPLCAGHAAGFGAREQEGTR